MKGLSIRWRLTLWFGVTLAAMFCGFSLVIYLMTQQRLLAQTDFELDEELDELEMEIRLAADVADVRRQLDKRFGRHATFDYQVCTLDGENLFLSERLADRPLPVPSPNLRAHSVVYRNRVVHDLGRYRVATKNMSGSNVALVARVLAPLARVEMALNDLIVTLLSVGPIVLVCALTGGYVLARRVLTPVDRMIVAAESISAQRLNQQLEISNPRDEFGRLAQTLNGMLSRLHSSFDEMRRFTADAAHELRTPLAVLRTEVEVALRAPRSARQYQRVLESVLEEAARLTRLTDQLLMLCREDAGLNPARRENVRLDAVLTETTDDLRVVAEQKGVALRAHDVAPATVQGDPGRLRQLCFNLLDNAIKYTPAGGRVSVRTESCSGQVHLLIEDTGRGIPPEHQPHIFKRFYRADGSRNGTGTGLGLAICKAIAEAHRGRIRVESAVGRGTQFRLSFPMCCERIDGRSPAELANQ